MGYYDVDDKEIGLYLTSFGTLVGNKYSAGIDSGLNVELNLWVAKGNIGVFKKDNQLKLRYGLSVGVGPFTKSYSDEAHLLDI